jgi:hypothetical protein
LNRAGADLHHFVRLAVVEPGYAAFTEALLHRYSERLRDMHGLDRTVLELSAHAYALRRSMRRAVLRKETAEIAVALQIYDRLKRLLILFPLASAGAHEFPTWVLL